MVGCSAGKSLEDTLYLAAIYDRAMPVDLAMRVIRVRMWEMGHTMDEIDSMNIQDIGDVIAYWREDGMIQKKRSKKK